MSALSESPVRTPGTTHTSPTKPITVAIVGAGYIAGYHLSALRRLSGVEVVGVCEPNAERRRALCAHWQIPRGAASLDELLEKRRPDVVHVLVPPAYHFPVTMQALEA